MYTLLNLLLKLCSLLQNLLIIRDKTLRNKFWQTRPRSLLSTQPLMISILIALIWYIIAQHHILLLWLPYFGFTNLIIKSDVRLQVYLWIYFYFLSSWVVSHSCLWFVGWVGGMALFARDCWGASYVLSDKKGISFAVINW